MIYDLLCQITRIITTTINYYIIYRKKNFQPNDMKIIHIWNIHLQELEILEVVYCMNKDIHYILHVMMTNNAWYTIYFESRLYIGVARCKSINDRSASILYRSASILYRSASMLAICKSIQFLIGKEYKKWLHMCYILNTLI